MQNFEGRFRRGQVARFGIDNAEPRGFGIRIQEDRCPEKRANFQRPSYIISESEKVHRKRLYSIILLSPSN